MADTTDIVSVERVIPAPPEKIFDLLADPARHREIDGSGTVRDAKAGSERLALGSKFGMAMKMGIPYSMRERGGGVRGEPEDRLADQAVGSGGPSSVVAGSGATSSSRSTAARWCGRAGTSPRRRDCASRSSCARGNKTVKNMEKTLARIEELVTA